MAFGGRHFELWDKQLSQFKGGKRRGNTAGGSGDIRIRASGDSCRSYPAAEDRVDLTPCCLHQAPLRADLDLLDTIYNAQLDGPPGNVNF